MVYCSVILNFKMTVRSETVLIVVIADAILDAIFLTAVTAIRNFAQRFMYEVPALLFDVARLFVLAINLWILPGMQKSQRQPYSSRQPTL